MARIAFLCAAVLLTVCRSVLCQQLPAGTPGSQATTYPTFLSQAKTDNQSGQSEQKIAEPKVSGAIAKPLQAAQRAIQNKDFGEAIAKIREAQANPIDKTAYDNYVINVLLIQVYQAKNDPAELVEALGNAIQNQYVTTEQRRVWYQYIAQYRFGQKDYNKALEAAEQAMHLGATDADTMSLIAKAEYLSGEYKEAAGMMQQIVGKQEKPDEDSLRLLWQFNVKAGDDAGADGALEKLVALYPKPEYWQIALAPLISMDSKDLRLQLNVYRLMDEVGVLKLSRDYADMAEIAQDQGYPGETVSVLQEAFRKNVFVDQGDKDRYQRLLDRAKLRAATDQAQLDKSKPPDADGLIQLGAAYMSYGQYDRALANINKGIDKGDLKSVDEAYLLLGIARLRMNERAEAQRAFGKVATSSNTGYSRLGMLWAARAGSGI
jgi:tetratricopeptide (TPR) repeat protein